MRRYGQRGFTMLEMLVALTVFAFVSVMVYGGQMAVLRMKEGTERQALFLKQIQGAVGMLERDLGQHVLRPVRDEFGDSQPPMVSADYGDYRLTLTRAGWLNPLGQPRSTLQRVAYGLEDERLLRYSWNTLDRAQGSEPYRVVLLESVRALQLRFLDRDGEWHEQWPPLEVQQGAGATPPATMPAALELTLELQGWGAFRRLLPLAGGV